MSDKIAMVDLKAQYQRYKTEIDAEIGRVIESTAFCGGPEAKAFAEAFAAWHGAEFRVATCGNATDGLQMALEVLNIGKGCEVITVSHCVVCDVESILAVGATPVFADIDPATFCIDPARIEKLINKRTKAIIPVHLYGHPCDMDTILEIAKKHNLLVIEDCAQSHGAIYKGKKVGTMGDLALFSFFPSKNLGGYGDSGAIMSRNKELIDKVQALGNHGRQDRYLHQYVGHNSRMDGIQAAILRVKLKHLDEDTKRRQAAAELYFKKLRGIKGVKPTKPAEGTAPVYHLFVVRVPAERREALRKNLQDQGIPTEVHYPTNVHQQPCMKSVRFRKGPMTKSEKAAQEVLSLPMSPDLTEAQIIKITDAIRAFFA